MDFFNRFFGKIENWIASNHFNLLATLYFNFRTMPIKQALKLPVYIYGRNIRFVSLKGSVSFDCQPVRGMVKIGRHQDYYSPTTRTIVKITKSGGVIFKGYSFIAQGVILNINGGTLVIDDRATLGQSVLVDCNKYIEIGFDCRIAYSCKLSDSNHHYIASPEGNVARTEGRIIIGPYNWIGNNTVITKGCVTTSQTICTHGSLLNKNYARVYESDEPMLLAGTPAKLIKKGNIRIFSGDIENTISEFFKQNPDLDTYHLDMPLENNVCELRYYL